MKIGDNVFVHGYVDEIRTDTVIIRNNGGFFGTVPGEIVCGETPEWKRGRWIVYYECPKCGEITKDFTEYCPFCNADMRGEEDG